MSDPKRNHDDGPPIKGDCDALDMASAVCLAVLVGIGAALFAWKIIELIAVSLS